MQHVNDYLTAAFAILGASGTILATLGAVLPKEWPFTKWCARVSTDIKGIHQPGRP